MALTIPDVPNNVYTLLSNAADSIDTANGLLTTHKSKLDGMQHDTNKAVTTVTSTSKGLATDTLSDLWTSTQVDFGVASDPLGTFTSSTCMGGSPNQLRQAVDANKPAIQNGIQAIERRNTFRRKATPDQLSLEDKVEGIMQDQYELGSGGGGLLVLPGILSNPIEAGLALFSSALPVEEWLTNSMPGVNQTLKDIVAWTQEIQAMESSLGNVAMALEVMLVALNNLNNNGFSAGTCATGFVPGTPLPVFPANAFALQKGGDNPYQDLANQYKEPDAGGNYTNKQVDDIVLWGEEQGLSVDQIKALLNSNFDAASLEQLLENGQINASNADDVISMLNSGVDPKLLNQWLTSGLVNASNIDDVTSLCKNGVDPATVDQWLTQGRSAKSIHQLAVTAQDLAAEGVSPEAINTLFKQKMDFSNVAAGVRTLRARGMSIDAINYQIEHSGDSSSWSASLNKTGIPNAQNGIAACLQRWKNGTSLPPGGWGQNDGGIFTDRPQPSSKGGSQPPFPTPPPIAPPLQEYYVNSSARMLIDGSGRAYFYPYHYDPGTRIQIPFDVLLSLLG